MKLNEKEALRYLGFRGKPADADTDEMIREIGGEMLRTLTPKCVYKRYDIKVLENAVELDGWRIESIKLSRHLRGCKAAYLFAATLGLQADMMIRRLSALNMARGTVAHSVANALIEDYCDEMQAQIAEKQQTLETSLAELRRLCARKPKRDLCAAGMCKAHWADADGHHADGAV
mgnify:CR=1 FL=1